MKKEAQEEARQRAAKAKARRHQVSMVQVCSKDDDDYVPPMLLPIGINTANDKCHALLDSGADVNVMAAHIYEAFVTNTLTSSTRQLNSIANQTVDCHGMITVSVYVKGHKENCQFYVTKSDDSAHDVILGRSWMSRHRCQFNWEANSISLVFGTTQITIPAIAEASGSSKTQEAAKAATKMSSEQVQFDRPAQHQKADQAKKVKQPRVQAQFLHTSNNYIWVPKSKVAATTYNHQRQGPKSAPRRVACQRWIPKTLLHAQNFYTGNKYIWVPKITHCKSGQKQALVQKQAIPIYQQNSTQIQCATKPKTEITAVGLTDGNNILPQKLSKGKQIVEMHYSSVDLAKLHHNIISLPSTSLFPWCLDSPLQKSNLSIKQRAQLLQGKLFGTSSLLTASQVAVC